MELQATSPQLTKDFDEFTKIAVVETFAGNLYTISDYDGEHVVYVKYERCGDRWSIEQSSFEMSMEQKGRCYDMVWEFINENQ